MFFLLRTALMGDPYRVFRDFIQKCFGKQRVKGSGEIHLSKASQAAASSGLPIAR